MENNFKVIIPVYNSEKWIKRCIWSVEKQKYKNWKCVIVNDASKDQTHNIIMDKLKNSGDLKHHFRYFIRDQNVGALENIVYGISSITFNDDDIVVLLDGDDALLTYDVLTHLNEVYQDKNILMTYGQFLNESNQTTGCNKPLKVSTKEYRAILKGEMYWCTSHLRTFRYKIWKRIQDVDLRDPYGKYFAMAWDMAIMYPLIEMSGNSRIKFIDKALYLYNDLNPINDFKKNLKLQELTAEVIKRKMQYRMLRDDEI